MAQVSMFPPGREALLQDPAVAEALQQVAAEGWTSEAKLSAESALLAMSDRQPEADTQEQQKQGLKHIMLSYQVRGVCLHLHLPASECFCICLHSGTCRTW
jgi:hypothetical protein